MYFTAAHHYHRPDWAPERNAERFGASRSVHGHDYRCEVTVGGSIDPESGMLVDLALLDRILATEVRDRFDQTHINRDIPEFADGRLVPTGENLARFIFEHVQAALGGAARVERVLVAEDATLWSEYGA